jgi:hypothetical protein
VNGNDEPEVGGTVVEVHHEGVLSRRRTRWLVIALIGFAIITCWGGFKIIDITNQIKDTQRNNHESRLEEQARTDREIRQLACIIVSQTNPGLVPLPSCTIVVGRLRLC